MLKMLLLGEMLFLGVSCHSPTLEKPITMYALSLEFNEAGFGLKDLNYKHDRTTVGEWVSDLNFTPIQSAPTDMMCFTMHDWLLIVKPKLKEASEYYHDYN